MNKSELIITVAAVSLRIWGLIMCITALINFLHWESALAASNIYKTTMSATGRQDGALALLHLVLAILFFAKTSSLSRLVCRGLENQLQP